MVYIQEAHPECPEIYGPDEWEMAVIEVTRQGEIWYPQGLHPAWDDFTAIQMDAHFYVFGFGTASGFGDLVDLS